MRIWPSLAITALVCFLFWGLINSVTKPWLNLVTNTEINQALSEAMLAHHRLAQLLPEEAIQQHQDFEHTQKLLAHMEVLQANRPKMARRFNSLLLAMFGLAGSIFLGFHIWESRRTEQGLARVRGQLLDLAAGRVPPSIHAGAGIWLRLEQLIQETHQQVAKDRERLKSLEHLKSWQEAARRMAHEIRTPLTTLSQSLKRWQSELEKKAPDLLPTWREQEGSMREELRGLSQFANQISHFAKVRSPQREATELNDFILEFLELYDSVWPNLELTWQAQEPLPLPFDRGMIRQVLVNLLNNASAAVSEGHGHIIMKTTQEDQRLGLWVMDDGPGIPVDLLPKLFEPYVSSKPYGQGTGLGLAISRKIMLEHGGDLDCAASSQKGTQFVLWFPWEGEK